LLHGGLVMTPRQEKLATLVAGGMKPKDAYVQAGYTGRYPDKLSSEILNNPEVAARVRELQRQEAKACGFTPEQVCEEGVKLYKLATEKTPVVDKRGEIVGERVANLPAGVNILKMFAGFHGMTTDIHSIELSGETRRVLDAVIAAIAAEVEDPAVLERIISRLTREGAGQ
jgi:hypothetical protein